MANKKLSQLTTAGSLSDTDIIPIVDGAGTKKVTAATVKTYATSALSTVATSGSYNDLTNKPTIPSLAAVSEHIVPSIDVTYDLGSATNRFRDLYLSNNTIYLGPTAISVLDNGQLLMSEFIEGGEGIGGISWIEWTTNTELLIRTQDNSAFIEKFDTLKKGDVFELLTGSTGNFSTATEITVDGTVTKTLVSGGGYYDFVIPVNTAASANVFVYTFNLKRSQVTDASQLKDTSNLLGGGSGVTLPSNASGYLTNDGSGNLSWAAGDGTFSGNYNDLTNKPTIPAAVSELTNDTGFITSNVSAAIIPTTDNTIDLGTPTNRFRHLYVAPGTIYLGDIKLSNVNGKLEAKKVINPGEDDEEEDENDSDAFSDLRDVFSGNYNDLTNKPTIPADISDLTDNDGLLGGGGGPGLGNFTFTDNKITFPDGTIQTTAYVTSEQKGFFLEFKKGDNQAAMQAVTVDSDGNTYASYSYYDDNESRRYGGVVKVGPTGSVIWTKNIQSSTSGAEYSRIASLEWAMVSGLPALSAYGYFYNSSTNRDVSFTYFIHPDTGELEEISYDLAANYAIELQDGVFEIEGSPMSVTAGESYGVNLTKSFTVLSPSTVDRVYISWAEFEASGLVAGDQVSYNNSYGMTINRFDVNASEDGLAVWEGISMQVSVNKDGSNYTYNILGSNGWGYLVNNWMGQIVNLKVLGSKLGGVDGVNDLTFTIDMNIFQGNSNNFLSAISNIQGTPFSDSVVCIAWNGKDWSTEIGNTLNFDYQLNRQAFLMKIGGTSQWTKSLGTGEYEQFKSVVVDSSKNVYAVGYYWRSNKGSFVVKYNSAGVEQWAVYVDPANNTGNEVTSIDILADGNLIVVDEDGTVTKLNSTTGAIIWQTSIDYNNNISFDSDFRGVTTPSGDYIITNYEDNDYTLYVISVSGTDGSVQWVKRISRTWGGNNGEIYPQDDYNSQYIDCGADNVVIAATTYINFNGNSTYAGLLISIPLDGEDIDGVYEQYVVASASVDWQAETTTSTPVTIVYQEFDDPTIAPPTGVSTTQTLTDTKTSIGGGAGGTGDITFDGSKLSSPATGSGDWPNGVITLAPGATDNTNLADYGQYINIYPTNAYDSPHIHIAPGFGGSNSNGSLILGNDEYHVEISNNGSVYVRTNNQNYSWEFDTSGNFRLPSGGDILNSSGNSVLGGGGVTLPSNASGYLTNDGAGNLAWAAGDGTFSGNYNDLTNKPTIPTDVSDLTDTSGLLGGGGGSGISLTDLSVTTSSTAVPGGSLSYDSVTGTFTFAPADYPTFATVATSGDYLDLMNTPMLAAVATTGAYTDLVGGPNLALVATSGDYSDLNGTPILSTVATSGSYDDLTNKPTSITDFGITDGTNNQVLTTNGSGTFTFANPSVNANDLTGTTLASNVVNSSLTSTGTLTSLTVTGTTTLNGTDSNVTRRAFGLVAADTYVTLDDIKARVTSGTSQLSLMLTSGSWQGTGWTETYTMGSPSVSTWINLPLSMGFDNASGAMNSQGNGCRCVIGDQTPSAKLYQITVTRLGTSGSQWAICIERLV